MSYKKWVELIGLPGCGKTTLVNYNIQTISNNYKVVESRDSNLVRRIRRNLLCQRYLAQSGFPNSLAKKISHRLSCRPFFCGNKRAFFFDSGLIQPIIEYLIDCNFVGAEAVLLALADLPLVGCTVYVKDNLESIVSRELSRADRRYPDLDYYELLERYTKGEEIIQEGIAPLLSYMPVVEPTNNIKFIKELI